MKKSLIALVLALLSVLLSTAVAEYNYDIPYVDLHPGVLAFENVWVSDDGETRMEAYSRREGFEILIIRMTGERQFVSWEYLPEYDEATKTLKAVNGLKSFNESDETMNIIHSDYEYEDGHAEFSLDENGKMIWKDEVEDAGAGIAFNPIGLYVGDYTSGRASIQIRWNLDNKNYDIAIVWGNSVTSASEWMMHGEVDKKTGNLVAQGTGSLLTFTEDGEVDPNAENPEEPVTATFYFNTNGYLIWNSSDGAGDGLKFENNWLPLYCWDGIGEV